MWTMTREQADQAIFENIYAASTIFGDDVNLVACEIMFLFAEMATPKNHQLIMDIINEAGGVREHQANHTFLMKLAK